MRVLAFRRKNSLLFSLLSSLCCTEDHMIWKVMRVVMSLTAILAITLWLYRPCMPVHAQSQQRASVPSGDVEVLSQKLPAMDGANLTVKLIDVTYAPGAASRPHSHPCVVVG